MAYETLSSLFINPFTKTMCVRLFLFYSPNHLFLLSSLSPKIRPVFLIRTHGLSSYFNLEMLDDYLPMHLEIGGLSTLDA